MLENFFINRFNKKYAGKELFFCEKIYSEISFLPYSVQKCCHCTRMPYSPPFLFKYIIKKFNFFNYLKEIDTIMESNQTEKAACKNCTFLKKQIVPQLNRKETISFFTINHFTKCNSNCIYCSIGNKTEDPQYKLLPIIKQMINDKMINEDCLFNWGGGEPTLCSEFDEIAKFLGKKKYKQAINSSGIIFSQTILDGLKNNTMSIQISPDAGTEETYQKIKKQNNFDKVWKNIKKYSEYNDALYVKYIFFSFNSNENDVRKFIKKCVENNVKNIVIDCESNSAHNERSPFGKITEETIKLAILMKKLAIENNLNYQISYLWKDEHRLYIANN